ncbi:MAG: putative quinol monooxygenase [Chlamydiota bacterium]
MDEIFMIAKVKAKPGLELAMESELAALVQATHFEEGCLLYALYRDLNDLSRFVIIERFSSKNALDAHYASNHFSNHFSMISPMLEKDPEIIQLSSLGAGEKGKLF